MSVVIPTRDRPDYFRVALGSLGTRDGQVTHGVLVVDDGSSDATSTVASEAGASHRGRQLRAHDRRRYTASVLGNDLPGLAGRGWHTVRRPQGLISDAHSTGRLGEHR